MCGDFINEKLCDSVFCRQCTDNVRGYVIVIVSACIILQSAYMFSQCICMNTKALVFGYIQGNFSHNYIVLDD
jgi:hypothetical protein